MAGLDKLAEAARAVIGLDWVTGAAVTLLAAVAAYGRDDIDECRSELNHLSVAHLPAGEPVVAIFGEIDCRAREGLFPYLRLPRISGVSRRPATLVAIFGEIDIDECRSELNHLSVAAHDPERLQQGLAAWRRLIEANFGARSMPEHRPLVATLSYRDYIEALLSFRDSRADLYTTSAENTLHLVGDSHSLAPAHTSVALDGRLYRVRPHTVIGAKVWHLARGVNSRSSLQRTTFERVAAHLPAGEPVVAIFGEIDCRAREGLFPYLRDHPDVDRTAHIRRVAEAYVATLADTLAAGGRRVLVCGVPAPARINANKAGAHVDSYLAMIAMFNTEMRAAANAANLRFIDPYTATADPDGVSNGLWRLDTVHLTPDLFATLF